MKATKKMTKKEIAETLARLAALNSQKPASASTATAKTVREQTRTGR